MKKLFILLFIILYSLFTPRIIFAEYVLPYPSYMPGNKLYRLTRIVDQLKKYWYWGNIASVKYHIGLSDKYLVEAKTLFEYKQYLLAADALTRSDGQLTDIPTLLQQGEKEKEDMSQLRQIICDAMQGHMVVLSTLKTQLPEEFIWKPEKTAETSIHIEQLLDSSLELRQFSVCLTK